MALAKTLRTSGRSLTKLTNPSLSAAAAAAAPRSFCVWRTATTTTTKHFQNLNNDNNNQSHCSLAAKSGACSQTRAMTTTQRRLAAVEGSFRIEADTFGELKVGHCRRVGGLRFSL